MRRPKWIRALLLALLIAAIFAALGQWQLSRAVTSNGPNPNATTEIALPLTQLATAGAGTYEDQDGQMVTVTGTLVSPDFSIISSRLNGGTEGYWVVGQLVLDAPQGSATSTSVAVALGWASTLEEAQAAVEQLNASTFSSEPLIGRYVGSDGSNSADSQGKTSTAYIPSTMSVAVLINSWKDYSDTSNVFGGYIVAKTPIAGLTAIDSPIPQRTTELNWLNIFYAIEWVIFALAAIFFWYRLVRDEWERETEEAELEDAFAAPGPTKS
jgi:surfeit locus 1 family protein